MNRLLIILCLVLLPFGVRAHGIEQFLGSYIYTHDGEEEKIELTQLNGTLAVVYSGVADGGEHGEFYFLVRATDVQFTPPNHLAFVIGMRDLAPRRIKGFRALEQMEQRGELGFARTPMYFDGVLKDGGLTLHCSQREDYGRDCAAAEMRFIKRQRR